VALGADFHVQRLGQSGLGLERITAAAVYGDLFVLRMGVGFHIFNPYSSARRVRARAGIIHELRLLRNFMARGRRERVSSWLFGTDSLR
jgi:hypothetical protein